MAAKDRKLSTVCVYCGAKPGKKPIYGEKAAALGSLLAARGVAVVYGGSRFGCLGKLADAVVAGGGKLTGIIPTFFTAVDTYSYVGEELIVPDMHTRKKLLFDKADVFIALPGGVGTMEELTEMLTWSKLGLHHKPIGLLNLNGYYDCFIQWLSLGIEEGFIPADSVSDLLFVSDSPEQLLDGLTERWLITAACKEEITLNNHLTALTSNLTTPTAD